jgi:hypothetical protein
MKKGWESICLASMKYFVQIPVPPKEIYHIRDPRDINDLIYTCKHAYSLTLLGG